MRRFKGYIYNKFIRPIFTINDTPHSIALGVALGVFIALTPTVGMQMLLILVIGTLVKANRIIGVLLVWISNPITMVPLYYGYYWLGGKLLGVELWTFGTFSVKYDAVMAGTKGGGFFGFFEVIWRLTVDIGPSLFLGSLIVATLCSVPLYPWVLYLLHRRRNSGNGDMPEGEDRNKVDPRAQETGREDSEIRSNVDKPTSIRSTSCRGKVAEPVSKSNS